MSEVRAFLRRGNRSRGPWAIASFIAIPLFFSSLMASTLAQEKPYVIQWKGVHHLITQFHEPTSATEARVWLWALLPPVLLSFVGWICVRLPFGWYIACGAAVVEAFAVVHKLDTWTAHHTARFPLGVDLIPKSNFQSNQSAPGEWEKLARETSLSLQHWTIGLAVASAAVMAALYARRVLFARRPALESAPLEGVHAPDATAPGLDPGS
jgi:hypothetical protein